MLVVAVAIGISACIQKSFGDPLVVSLDKAGSGLNNTDGLLWSLQNDMAIAVNGSETAINFFRGVTYVVVDFWAAQAPGSNEVTISYIFDQAPQNSIPNQEWYQYFAGQYEGRHAAFAFSAKLAGNTVPIDSAIIADPSWTLDSTFPSSSADFDTSYRLGVPPGSSFTLDFDIPGGPSVPDASATWMLLAGAVSCLLFWKRRQNQSV